jgi:hypothetical protein
MTSQSSKVHVQYLCRDVGKCEPTDSGGGCLVCLKHVAHLLTPFSSQRYLEILIALLPHVLDRFELRKLGQHFQYLG